MKKNWKNSVITKSAYKNLLRRKDLKYLQFYTGTNRIIKDFLNLDLLIHTGRKFERLTVTQSLLNFKVGSFRDTRVTCRHKSVKIRNKKTWAKK